jgi:hypothetical protein
MSSVPAPLSRLQVKEKLTRELMLSTMPYLAHLLVVSSNRKSSSPPQSLNVPRSRFTGEPRDWYYVVVYFDLTFDYELWGCVNHDSLELYNRDSQQLWRVPKHFCQDAEVLCNPILFKLYQVEPKELKLDFSPEVIEEALVMRIRLYKFFGLSREFQDEHPLSRKELMYAGVGDQPKEIDTFVFWFITHAVSRLRGVISEDGTEELPMGRRVFGVCEAQLLLFKLHCRPALKAMIGLTLNAEQGHYISLEMASNPETIRRFLNRTAQRISDHPVAAFCNPALRACMKKFLDDLLHIGNLMEDDGERAENVACIAASSGAAAQRTAPPHSRDSMNVEDVRACAPACQQRLLCKALGSTKERAQTNELERRMLTHTLLEVGIAKDDVEAVMRPPVMIAYEAETNALMSWTAIQKSISDVAKARHKFAVDAERDNESREAADKVDEEMHQTCFSLMNYAMCPHLDPVPSHEQQLSKEEKRKRHKERYVKAKKACHAQLQETWKKRTAAGIAKGEKVKYAWTTTPYLYMQVAFRGEGVNTDKKPDPNKPAKPAKRKKAATSKKKKKAKKEDTKAEAKEEEDEDEVQSDA